MELSYLKINYSEEDNHRWYHLFRRQKIIISNLAYSGFNTLLEELNLPLDKVPQIKEVSDNLERKCGWKLAQIDQLISLDEFLSLLSNKIFPTPSFIKKQALGFNTEADIFHELFGHATMILDPRYSIFLEKLAKVALNCNILEKAIVEKIYWFTIETGLVKEDGKLRIYGSALLSAPDESIHAIRSNKVIRKKANILSISTTPLIEGIYNKYFYYINDLSELITFDLSHKNLARCLTTNKD
jgi:phenylalanine-4-hydroxylase